MLVSAALMLALTSCSGPTTPAVETIKPKATETASAPPSEEPAAEAGTRDNPLAIGEQRKMATDSMWSVGAEAASVVGAGYVVLPLHLGVDWEAARAQGVASSDGVDPWTSLIIEYVTPGGRSYSSADTYVEVSTSCTTWGRSMSHWLRSPPTTW